MVSADHPRTMELEGNLRTFKLPDILRFLALGRMTGTLTISSGPRTVELSIGEGLLIGAASPERYLKLGQLLIYGGHLSRRDLEEALEHQEAQDGEMMLGELLIQRGYVQRETIDQLLELQLKEEMWELFSWCEGSFNFEHGTTEMMERAVLKLEMEPLIDEGLDRLEQWRSIAQHFSEVDQIFRVRGELETIPEVRMTPNTWRVLSLVNGRHSLQTLMCISGLGKFETLCAIDRLMDLGLIESMDAPEAAEPAEYPERAEPEPAREPGAAQEPRGWFKLAFRGARRDGAEEAATAVEVQSYQTSAGMACELINHLIDRLTRHEGYVGETPGELCRRLWREEGMRFPRADLIELSGGRLAARRYERYVTLGGGVGPSLTRCHEDTMAALAAVGRALVEHAREALGEQADGLLAEWVKPRLEGLEVVYPPDFLPRSWTRQWLDITNAMA